MDSILAEHAVFSLRTGIKGFSHILEYPLSEETHSEVVDLWYSDDFRNQDNNVNYIIVVLGYYQI